PLQNINIPRLRTRGKNRHVGIDRIRTRTHPDRHQNSDIRQREKPRPASLNVHVAISIIENRRELRNHGNISSRPQTAQKNLSWRHQSDIAFLRRENAVAVHGNKTRSRYHIDGSGGTRANTRAVPKRDPNRARYGNIARSRSEPRVGENLRKRSDRIQQNRSEEHTSELQSREN